jgi:hypothetical protein
MLADTLTLASGTYTKIAADTESGSRYSATSGYGDANPFLITVKHQLPSNGRGIRRHLVQIIVPIGDGTGSFPTGKNVTCNFTVAYPVDSGGLDTSAVNTAVADLLKALAAGYTGSSTFLTAVRTGAQ